jgi:hypothetical protein
MSRRKNSATAKIRRNRSRIERELEQGRPKNEVRKILIKEGIIPPVSAAHFNNIVSEFELETPSVEVLPNDGRPAEVASMVGQSVGQVPVRVQPSSPTVLPGERSAAKRYFDTPSGDDRFDAEMSGAVK